MYYTRIDHQHFQKCGARTLSGAKNSVSRRNPWLGVRLQVAVEHRGDLKVVSQKKNGPWQDYEVY